MEVNSKTSANAIESDAMTKRDYWLGAICGLLIGLLFLPVLKTAAANWYLKLWPLVVPFFLIAVPVCLVVARFIARKIVLIWQLAKFVATGVLNVLVDFGTLAIEIMLFEKYFNIKSTDVFLNLGLVITFYSLFKAISFTVSNINSYFWNKYWTFDKRKDNQSEFVQFFIVSIVGFIVNVVVASFVFNGFSSHTALTAGQWALIGAAAGSVAGLAWNFLGYKFIVFKE
ncbi:MAG: GtrA family protein [Candidatus Pacebacteria bacterium]|nr:GtrA family protein [Candidatus Paceibacterota bacterium]MDR3583113.1 GtrA family protein [Candidatus Paceibacterota bacterium]